MYGLESGRPDFSHKHANHRQQIEPLISLYQDGEANTEERRTVEYYLERCAQCRALLATFVQVESDLRSYAQKTPVPRINPSFFRQADLIEKEKTVKAKGMPKVSQTQAQILPFTNPNIPLIEGGRTTKKRPTQRFLAQYGGTIAAWLLLAGVVGLLFLSINSLQLNPTNIVSGVITPVAMPSATTTALTENNPTPTTAADSNSTRPTKTDLAGTSTDVTNPKSSSTSVANTPKVSQTTQATSPQTQPTESATHPSSTTNSVSNPIHTTATTLTIFATTPKVGSTVATNTTSATTANTTLATVDTNTPVPNPTVSSQAPTLGLTTSSSSTATTNNPVTTDTTTGNSTNTVTANSVTAETATTLASTATPTLATSTQPANISPTANNSTTSGADNQTPTNVSATTVASKGTGNGQTTNTTPVATADTSNTTISVAVTTPVATINPTDSTVETSSTTVSATTPVPTTPSTATSTNTTTATVATTAMAGPIRADGWLAYVATHDGEIHLVASDGSNDHALTNNTSGINWHQLVWSPDHRWLAAVGSNKRGINQIYLLDTSSNHPDINPIVNGFDPMWSPNSLQLAYLATEVSGATTGRNSVIDLKHRIVTHLNDNLTSLSPQWFPDGQRLLVGQDTIYRVMLSNKSSGYQINLVQHLNLDFINTCTATALSPEGSRLAALEQDKNGLPELVIYNLAVEGAAPTTIATIKKADETLTMGRNCGQQRLTWTPTGHSVFFYAQGANKYYTVLVSATSGETKFLGGVLEPSFNSNSNYLVDYNPTTKQVYVISANSSRPTNPYSIANASFAPVWQPNM
jgi:hypothetical protein